MYTLNVYDRKCIKVTKAREIIELKNNNPEIMEYIM